MAGTSISIVRDTGWILPTLDTDITVAAAASSGHYGVRRIGRLVYISIAVAIANPAAAKILFTLDPQFRPPAPASGSSTLVAMASGTHIQVRTDGTVRAFTGATSSNGTASWPAAT